MALAYGADAVYLAGNAFGMRAFAGNFDREGLAAAVGTGGQPLVQVGVIRGVDGPVGHRGHLAPVEVDQGGPSCPNTWSIWIPSGRMR